MAVKPRAVLVMAALHASAAATAAVAVLGTHVLGESRLPTWYCMVVGGSILGMWAPYVLAGFDPHPPSLPVLMGHARWLSKAIWLPYAITAFMVVMGVLAAPHAGLLMRAPSPDWPPPDGFRSWYRLLVAVTWSGCWCLVAMRALGNMIRLLAGPDLAPCLRTDGSRMPAD